MGDLKDKARAELVIRGYARRTIKAYLFYMQDLARFHMRSPEALEEADIKAYILHLLEERHLSRSSQNVATSAILFLYRDVLCRPLVIDNLRRPRPRKTLPKVLSRDLILRIAELADSSRDRLAIFLMYGSGLRVSEVTRLRVEDLDLPALRLWVRDGKGFKDRQTVLAERALLYLGPRVSRALPKAFVFPGRRGRHISVRALQRGFKTAARRAGAPSWASCHCLRHSFATHLLEGGVDIRYIQTLLGHHRLETTTVYAKVRKASTDRLKSPL